jgi:transposase
MLVKIKRDLDNQIRGLLKNMGLVVGKAKRGVFSARVKTLIADHPVLAQAVEPLLVTRDDIGRKIADLDGKLNRLARDDEPTRLFMTMPGIGPITALAYRTTIDDPTRFKRSQNVGAYV